MNILMLTSRFGSGYGMGYSAFKEAVALTDLGHFVTVIHGNRDVAQYRNPHITLIHVPIRRTAFIGFALLFLRLRWLFKSQVRVKDFDVIYIQSLEFGVMHFKKIHVPVFYFARSTMLGMQDALQHERGHLPITARLTQKILVRLERRCFLNSKMVFVKSSLMVGEVSRLYNIQRERISIVSGGIDAKDFSAEKKKGVELRKKLGIDSETYVFLYAGRIVPQKGLMYFVKAALNALENSTFVVIVAGADEDHPYATSVKNVLGKSRHKNAFYFLGHVDQAAMSSVYAVADCLVTPSLYEPFGMVNLQAASLGKTVITTTVAGSVDVLVNYQKKVVIPPGSVTALEEALGKAVHSWKRGDSFSTDFTRYSWPTVAKQLQESFTRQPVFTTLPEKILNCG